MTNSLWNGNTYIEAGMRDGIGVLMNSAVARANAEKTLIVLTDGRQNQGEARLAAADAAADNITIHTITFGDYADKTLMAAIAATGSGRYAHADDAAGLQHIMLDLAVTLTTLVEASRQGIVGGKSDAKIEEAARKVLDHAGLSGYTIAVNRLNNGAKLNVQAQLSLAGNGFLVPTFGGSWTVKRSCMLRCE